MHETSDPVTKQTLFLSSFFPIASSVQTEGSAACSPWDVPFQWPCQDSDKSLRNICISASIFLLSLQPIGSFRGQWQLSVCRYRCIFWSSFLNGQHQGSLVLLFKAMHWIQSNFSVLKMQRTCEHSIHFWEGSRCRTAPAFRVFLEDKVHITCFGCTDGGTMMLTLNRGTLIPTKSKRALRQQQLFSTVLESLRSLNTYLKL